MSEWRQIYVRFYVTGKGEESFLADFFRQLTVSETGLISFTTEQAFKQIRAATNPKKASINQKTIPREIEAAAISIRKWIAGSDDKYAVLVYDLESIRRLSAANEYRNYRGSVDRLLNAKPGLSSRFSVHFFVNMVEAYYFNHHEVVNEVCGTLLTAYPGDVENIRHPKGQLKEFVSKLDRGRKFDEVIDGEAIAKKLDLQKVLDNPEHCCALRTLVAWIWEAMGRKRGDEYQLQKGHYWEVTAFQLKEPPPANQNRPLDAEE